MLGIFGGLDAAFQVDFYPDVDNHPNHKEPKEIIIELKTGLKKIQHSHQTMSYLMIQFGEKVFDNIGLVLYSESGEKNSYLIDVIEPDPKYFLEMVLHRNFYMLDVSNYQKWLK